MAYLDPSRHASDGASRLSRLGRAVDDFTAAYRRWSAARRRDELLCQLTDRELDDVGMNRAARIETRYSPFSARV